MTFLRQLITERVGWTGGQYSLLRVIFGVYLLSHLAMFVPWAAELWSDADALASALDDASASPSADAFFNVLMWFNPPWFITVMVAAACGLCVLFIIGKWDRIASLTLWYILACLLAYSPLNLNPALPYVACLLIAHAFLPRAPFGSMEAAGRVDPGNGWRMPAPVFIIAWLLMAVAYSYAGITKLADPSWLDGTALGDVLATSLARPTLLRDALLLMPAPILATLTWAGLAFHVAFAPLAIFRRLRPWLWLAGAAIHISLIALLDIAALSTGLLVLHLFTFNPAWLAPRVHPQKEILFYDGLCGLCHRTVRLILAEDHQGQCFTLSPLQGELITRTLTDEQRQSLPDSVVVCTADGRVLTKSAAVLHLLDTLGGAWRIFGWCARAIPRPLRDAAYDGIASIRHRLFTAPKEACPMLPPELRGRFVY